VTLAGAEPYAPYWRPQLTRFLSEPRPADALAIKKPEWYAQNGVRLLLGKTAERIDIPGKRVLWVNGGEASFYDALIVAAGSLPMLPPFAGAEGALTLRSYDDAVKIREQALAKGKATVVGGGLLGLETAWELNNSGVKVSLVERSPWLLPRQLNRKGGLYLQRRLESSGIRFFIGQEPGTFAELYQDACTVVAAGVRSNLQALDSTGVALGRAVVVDDHMRTSLEGVFACGDIAEYQGRCWGLLSVAQEQGKIAGANAAGGEVVYLETPPSPMLKAGPVSVFSVGDMAEGDGVLALSQETEAGYACLTLKDGTLVGAALVGDTKPGMKLKKAVAEKREFRDAKKADEILSAI
jgi:nitrite reductase (NADH) large subunit